MSPLKIRILEIVRAQPGVTARELHRLVYGGRVSHRGLDTVRSHIHQINVHLAATSAVAIKGKSGEGYRIVERAVA